MAMCIGFPGLVVALDSDGAIVQTEGRQRRASTLYLPDIAVGDWVTVAAGTIVERLEHDQAADIQTMLRAAMTAALDPTHEGATDVHEP
jgi:hydrogenase assembly chaperone HypC/HupF